MYSYASLLVISKNIRCTRLHFYFYVRDYKCKFYTLFYTSQQLSLVCIFTVYATTDPQVSTLKLLRQLFASCYIQVCMRNCAVCEVRYSRAGQFYRSIDMQNLLLLCVTVKVLTLWHYLGVKCLDDTYETEISGFPLFSYLNSTNFTETNS